MRGARPRERAGYSFFADGVIAENTHFERLLFQSDVLFYF